MFDNRIRPRTNLWHRRNFFLKNLKSHVRVNRCVCVIYGITCRPCSTQLAFFFSFQRRFHVCFQFEYFLSSFAYRLLSDGCGRSMQICLVHTSGRVRSKIETCDNMNKINTMRRFETPKSRAPGKLNKTMKNSNRY